MPTEAAIPSPTPDTRHLAPILEVEDLAVSYGGGILALQGVSLRVDPGEVVALVGANGAGKTTLLKTIAGLLQPLSGEIRFGGQRINAVDGPDRVKLGMALVPEGRRLFSRLKVVENLTLGTLTNRDARHREAMFERVYRLFPILRERATQRAGTFSGGQQQMLAIGRALMSHPAFLMLDEPSLGIAPLLVEQIFDALRQLHQQEGLTMLLVEQNVPAALSLADRGYVLQTGRIVLEGTGRELLDSELVRKAYLGM
jgi:branched-chain amino acid transport system ATP-binding protein